MTRYINFDDHDRYGHARPGTEPRSWRDRWTIAGPTYIFDIYHLEDHMAASGQKLLVGFRATDNRFGVSRATLGKLADKLGLNETQVIHYALSQLATAELPAYEPDDGPLTQREIRAIQKLAGGRRGKSVRSSLF